MRARRPCYAAGVHDDHHCDGARPDLRLRRLDRHVVRAARRGAVFHVAVNPGARVVVRARSEPGAGVQPVTLHAENYGDRYAFLPGDRPWGRHPLLEAAIESVGVPAGLAVEIDVGSVVPPGASTGTSAAVCVALVGALRALSGASLGADDVARAAHAVETERLGQQSGLQDQLAAAHGGINYVEILDYPAARVSGLQLSDVTLAALEKQLLLFYLGRTHSSTAIHEQVIRGLADGSSPTGLSAMDALRASAAAARDAVVAGDLQGLGAAMRANTEAQRLLHPALVGPEARRVIEVVRESGALGWKVNGAGGEGGSLAVLCGAGPGARAGLEAAVVRVSSDCRLIRTTVARRGLAIVRQDEAGGADG